MHPGCGIQLAYKILMDASLSSPEKRGDAKEYVHEPVSGWITSPTTARHFAEGEDLIQAFIPPAAGDFAFMDDETTLASMPELLAMRSGFIICANLSGRIQFARDFGMRGYAATASPAFYEDMLGKIRKAAMISGMRFIEVLAPCPAIWKSEPSNTVEICRQAVRIGLWPLFEIERGVVSVSHKPSKLSPKTAFETMQEKIRVNEQKLEKEWRKFLIKPFEARI